MKIFYTATYQGKDQFGAYYRQIYDEIKKLGYTHLDDEVVRITYDEYVNKMNQGRAIQVKNYQETIDFIKNADICVLETSAHSLGLGFIVQKSLEMGKPTIVLHYDEYPPYFLQGIEDEKLIIKSYDEKTLKKAVKDVLQEAREKRDKRFNFFLSPKLLDYLDKASKVEGVTKSKLLRDMILRHMRENNETASE
ncbi:MAG: CopG family transcriptional regulator [Weeksellaceae bacterium]